MCGYLTHVCISDQLEDLLLSMGMKPTDHQMEEIINELDANGDGTITFSEFLRVMAVPRRGSAAFKLMSRVLGASRMLWSFMHAAVGMKIDRAVTTATRTDFWQVGSIRAAGPLPKNGQTYFEVTIKRPGRSDGASMNGFYFVGVCNDEVDIWDGTWWEDERASCKWAIRSETTLEEHNPKKDSRTHAELCGLGCESRVMWGPGTSWGSGDVIGVYIDLDESKMWFYRNGQPLDELPAFRNLPYKSELFAFCTLFHPNSSAFIAVRPLPATKPVDIEATAAGIKRFSTPWSQDYQAPGFVLREGKMQAHIDSLDMKVENPFPIPDSKLIVARPLSIRASSKLPMYEDSYFEICIKIPGRNFGASLQGGFYVGLCNAQFETWDGQWEWDDSARKGVWALHDSFGAKRAHITTPEKARIEWSKDIAMDGVTLVGYGSNNAPTGHPKPLPGFGNGDRIGFLVRRAIEGKDPLSPDILSFEPKDAEVVIFKNGKRRGLLHAGIKARDLWPFASLAPHQGAQVELHFPPCPEEKETEIVK